jgi:hypothetical protein
LCGPYPYAPLGELAGYGGLHTRFLSRINQYPRQEYEPRQDIHLSGG